MSWLREAAIGVTLAMSLSACASTDAQPITYNSLAVGVAEAPVPEAPATIPEITIPMATTTTEAAAVAKVAPAAHTSEPYETAVSAKCSNFTYPSAQCQP